MFKKLITYTDYNGVERSENFYFNLSKSELLEMQLGINGGLSRVLEKIYEEKDTAKITSYFKEIILKSYGERSNDGKYFLKVNNDNVQLSSLFAQTEAYTVLFMELAFDTKAAIEFINGLIPAGLNATLPQELADNYPNIVK